jgi:hypothetical protein
LAHGQTSTQRGIGTGVAYDEKQRGEYVQALLRISTKSQPNWERTNNTQREPGRQTGSSAQGTMMSRSGS